jgi:Fe-S cluster assembly protein SufD
MIPTVWRRADRLRDFLFQGLSMNSSAMDDTNTLKLGDAGVFDAHMASWPDMPSWLADMKREAWSRFVELPMPKRSDEAWRFATTGNLAFEGFSYASSRNGGGSASVRPVIDCGGCLDFADDSFAGGHPLQEAIAKSGVVFLPLERAIAEHPELVRRHLFGHMPNLGSAKFEALHVALFSTGVFLYVPKGVEVALPLAAMHESVREGGSIFPHTLVVADEGASVTMFDVYRTRHATSRHFACAAADLVALPGARIRHRSLQEWSDGALAFHLGSLTAERSSNLDSIAVNLGGGHVRAEQHGRIVGRGGEVSMHSLSLATDSREIDQRTLQTHSAEDGKSDLLYKNVLLGKSHTIFSGLIRVDEGAQRTDAFQTNRNLLLSPDADASSLPGLEILANDVKCSHGASTGQLDADQLFYLLARGIPRQQAYELMVMGFFEEVLQKIGNEELSSYMRSLLMKRFVVRR